MTIGYAPLEPLDSPAPFRPRGRSPQSQQQLFPNFMDTTECNYLVMFFVIGVLGLAIRDMTSK
jgi:hypothetical protein